LLGKFHWAPRTDYKRVIKQYENKTPIKSHA